MKGRPPSSNGGVYVPPHHRLRSVITCQNYTSPASFDSIPKNPKPAAASVAQPEDHFPRPSSPYISAYDDAFSEEGSDRELDSSLHPGAGPSDNIDQWKRKLTMLLRDKDKQELISREKKDRLDFEQIAILASRMGLHSHLYAKVVVVSKVPLPNYRFDLDDRRPQREVTLPLGLLRRVEAYVSEFLSQKSRTNERFLDFSFSRSSSNCSIATDFLRHLSHWLPVEG